MSISDIKKAIESFKKAKPNAVINYVAVDACGALYGYSNKPVIAPNAKCWYNPIADGEGCYSYMLDEDADRYVGSWFDSLMDVSGTLDEATYRKAVQEYLKENPKSHIAWVAQDANGMLCGYPYKPVMNEASYYNLSVGKDGRYYHKLGKFFINNSWTESTMEVSPMINSEELNEIAKAYLDTNPEVIIKWVAIDKNGATFGYSEKPEILDTGIVGCWTTSGRSYHFGNYDTNLDWKDTLVEIKMNELADFIVKYKTPKRGFQALPDTPEHVVKIKAFSREDAIATVCGTASSQLNVIISSCVPAHINYRVIFFAEDGGEAVTITANSLKDLANTLEERYPNKSVSTIEVHV